MTKRSEILVRLVARTVDTGTSNGDVWYNSATHKVRALLNGTARDLVAEGVAATLSDVTITGALNHDGTTIGFFNTAPITQIAKPGGLGGGATLAQVITRVNQICNDLQSYGIYG